MVTTETLKWIDLLLPAADARSELLRRAVRLLAARDGVLALAELARGLERPEHSLYVALAPWDGIRWEGICGNVSAHLAPWVRQAIGLPVPAGELLADLGRASQDDDEPAAYHRPGPLADVRAAVARCRNVSTVREGMLHAHGPRYTLAR